MSHKLSEQDKKRITIALVHMLLIVFVDIIVRGKSCSSSCW